MRVDVSEIKTFKSCRRQWQLSSRNKFHMRPIVTPPQFALGTIFHESLAQLYLGVPYEKVMEMVRREMQTDNDAALVAMEFDRMLPAGETPRDTEGYEGFYHLCEIRGDESSAEAVFILRDHDRDKFEARKAFLRQTADYLNAKYGAETFTLQLRDSYYNMKEKLAGHMHLIRNAEAAMQKAGIPPKVVPIRGGTDGARLSYEGLPCPNLSTGGVNFHSIHEFIPVRSLEKMVEVLKNLVVL